MHPCRKRGSTGSFGAVELKKGEGDFLPRLKFKRAGIKFLLESLTPAPFTSPGFLSR
jgi:hypothetical protein